MNNLWGNDGEKTNWEYEGQEEIRYILFIGLHTTLWDRNFYSYVISSGG